ncbi:hypothetical protein GCM10018783_45320 [Streptomyces griseosporeus]|nr:hypothetical protein GCM10018783_45320 [Streptomyces griseosporeus]
MKTRFPTRMPSEMPADSYQSGFADTRTRSTAGCVADMTMTLPQIGVIHVRQPRRALIHSCGSAAGTDSARLSPAGISRRTDLQDLRIAEGVTARASSALGEESG